MTSQTWVLMNPLEDRLADLSRGFGMITRLRDVRFCALLLDQYEGDQPFVFCLRETASPLQTMLDLPDVVDDDCNGHELSSRGPPMVLFRKGPLVVCAG